MNVFHHVALQSLKRSPARTLVTIVGIALAAALMTVVAAFGTSLLHFLVISAENKYGDWHVSFDAVDTAFVQAQAQDPQVAHTAVLENLGYATLEGVQSPEKPYLFLAGLPAASWDTLPIRLLSGRLPENDGEVLVPSHLACQRGCLPFRGGYPDPFCGQPAGRGHLPQPGRSLPPGRGNPGLHHRENLHCGGDLRTAHPGTPRRPGIHPAHNSGPPRASYLPPSVRHPVSPPPGAGLRRPHRVQRPGFVQ